MMTEAEKVAFECGTEAQELSSAHSTWIVQHAKFCGCHGADECKWPKSSRLLYLERHSQPSHAAEFGGAVGSPAKTLTRGAPTMAYVLEREENQDTCTVNDMLGVFSEQRLAEGMRSILQQWAEPKGRVKFIVHAVPRLE